MTGEIIYTDESLLSDSTRNVLVYLGIGAAAGIGIAVVYDREIYHDLRKDYDEKTELTKDLEKTADALALAKDHLRSKGLIDEETAIVMQNERLEITAEVREIKKDTPNIVLEQCTWAAASIIPGIAIAIGAWATHRRWKKQRE